MAVGLIVTKIDRGQIYQRDQVTMKLTITCQKKIWTVYYWTWVYTKWPAMAEIWAIRVLLVFVCNFLC